MMNSTIHSQIRFPLILLCLLVLFGATLLWILNLEGIIVGPWAAIFSALCTILGVLLALLQWQMPFSGAAGLSELPLTSAHTPQINSFNTPGSFGVSKRRGALIVKSRKSDIGTTIHLCSGFTSTPLATEIAANVTEYKSGSGSVFVAFFPTLKPGNYTVFRQVLPFCAFITIRANQVANVDLRAQNTKQSSKGESHGSLLY